MLLVKIFTEKSSCLRSGPSKGFMLTLKSAHQMIYHPGFFSNAAKLLLSVELNTETIREDLAENDTIIVSCTLPAFRVFVIPLVASSLISQELALFADLEKSSAALARMCE
jgi:hypothetical protein